MSTAKRPPGTGSSSAASPSHCVIRVGSVKNGKTRSGVASIQTDARTGSAVATVHLLLDGGLEGLQLGRPHVLEEVADRLQSLGTQDVEPLAPGRTDLDEAGVAERLEVQRHRLLRDLG